MELLLDTDTCIYAIKKQPNVLGALLAVNDDVAVSVVTEAELRTGAIKSTSPVKAIHLLENFLRPFTILDFTSHDTVTYAHIRARLERAGTPIGPHDTIIAAQALAHDLTLVTNNEREFRRVPGLRIENWRR